MNFERYKRLNNRERAQADCKMIIWLFYVGGATLMLISAFGAETSGLFSLAAAFFGLTSLVSGGAFQILHNSMMRGKNKDAYLLTIMAALGKHDFPLMPTVFTFVLGSSIFFTLLYVLSS